MSTEPYPVLSEISFKLAIWGLWQLKEKMGETRAEEMRVRTGERQSRPADFSQVHRKTQRKTVIPRMESELKTGPKNVPRYIFWTPDGTIYQPLRSGRIWHKVNF